MPDWFGISIVDLRKIANTLKDQVTELEEQLAERDARIAELTNQLAADPRLRSGIQYLDSHFRGNDNV